MSCFLLQNSILGNDPLGKNKTMLNPCENRPFEFPWMSLPSRACTVFGWHCGDRTAGTEDWQHRDYGRYHRWSCRVLVSPFVCAPGSHTQTLQCEFRPVPAHAATLHIGTGQLRRSHTANVKSVGRRSHRVNNSPKQPAQLFRQLPVPLPHYAPDNVTTMLI